MAYLSSGQLHLPANLPLFRNTAQQQSFLNAARAGVGGRAYQNIPPGLYNAGRYAGVGGNLVAAGGGQQLARATGTRGNVPIGGPPPAPSSAQRQAVPSGETQFNPPLRNSDGSDTEFGQLAKTDRNPIQEGRFQQLLRQWQSAHPPALPPPVAKPSPTPVPKTQVPIKGVSGATAALPSVSTGGGVAGQAFPPTSELASGTAGLQLAGLSPTAQAPSAQMIPALPVGPSGITPDFLSQLEGSTGANVPQTPQRPPWQMPIVPVPTPTPGENDQKAQERARQEFYRMQPRPARNLLADINLGQLGTPQAITTSQLTGGGLQRTPVQRPMASYGQLAGSLPAQQHPQAIQSFLSGQSSLQDVASAIASPQAQQTINRMIDVAQRSGDMTTVGRLADLHAAVQTQLNFINRIGQIVSAISAGFGTPNAPDVTEARTPLVQAGVGQALTTPPPLLAQLPSGEPAQQVQMETPQLPTASVDQYRRARYPFMEEQA